MRTNTYARLSLLIPFLVWALLLGYLVTANSLAAEISTSDATNPIGDWIDRAVAFYVFGILFWFLPYILLGLILFLLTFIWEPRLLSRVFALSPIVMVLFTLSVTTLITFWDPWGGTFTSNISANIQDFTFFNILLTVLILIWGYICVGMGYGMYKVLRVYGIIRDGLNPVPQPTLLEA